jgi:hypothetical protein
MIVLRGQVQHRHEANALLSEPGATVVVHRGVPRSVAMACPDGCGEQLTVNLDERAGPAWRCYQQGNHLTLYPSVWRDTGCRSHFIVWRSRIYWCDRWEELAAPSAEAEEKVPRSLSAGFIHYAAIAQALGLVPWEVLSACNRLVSAGRAQAGEGDKRGYFRSVQR